jgi:multiple sugar transport system substrate-binding protein
MAGVRRRRASMPSKRTIDRRDFLRVSGAGLAGMTLLGAAGCGDGGKRNGLVKLTLSHSSNLGGTLDKQLDAFNTQHRGRIQAERHQLVGGDPNEYFDRLQTEFQAGGTDIDVVSGDVVWAPIFAANGWILDLSERFPQSKQQEFLSAPIDSVTYDGKVWGVPWLTDVGMLFYREDLLEQSGFSDPPKTWEKLKEMAQKVKQESGTKYGFVFQGEEYEGGVTNSLEYIWTHGGDVLDPEDPAKVVINSPESAAGLAMERSMVTEGVAPPTVATYTEFESSGTFLGGDAVFCRMWPWMYEFVADPTQSEIKPKQVDAAPIPYSQGNQSYGCLGGWNLFINATSENKADAAWTLIQYLSAPEQQKQRALQGGYPPQLKNLYDDHDILNVPVIALSKEAIQNARSRPLSPYYSDISLKMADQFNRSLRGEVSPQQAVKVLQEELTDITERAR